MAEISFPRANVGQKAGLVGDVQLRADPQGALVVTDGTPRHYEAARQGRAFMISNGWAGVACAAANITPVAAAAATVLTLYNPQNSAVRLALIEAGLTYNSGTIEVGAFAFNVHYNTTITATANAVTKCLRPDSQGAGTTSSGVAKGFAQTALTGGIAGVESLPLGALPNVAGTTLVRSLEGIYVLNPGDALSIAAPTNGTSMVVTAWMSYLEIPQSP